MNLIIQNGDVYREGFYSFARNWAKTKDKAAALTLLCYPFSSYRSVWLTVYAETKIPRIEQLEVEIKLELWNEAKQYIGSNSLTEEQKKDVCRCLYTMEHYLNEVS